MPNDVVIQFQCTPFSDLDVEYSYPALLSFLDSFKRLCDSIETFGDPPIKFLYSGGKMVSFDDDGSCSLTQNSSWSSRQLDTNTTAAQSGRYSF